MDDWFKQLQTEINEAARDSSRWFSDLPERAEQAVELWVEGSVKLFEDIDRAIAPTLDNLAEQVDSSLDGSLDVLDQVIDRQIVPWIEQTTAPLTHTLNPWLQNHPTCIGCQHYHGSYYGEAMLVCGMHPYGPDEEICGDWESVWEKSESNRG